MPPSEKGLHAVWLPANQCYAVMFGDSLSGIGVPNRRFFPDKAELKKALDLLGLQLQRTGRIVARRAKASRKRCDQCASATVQGVFVHEHGCPNARREKRL